MKEIGELIRLDLDSTPNNHGATLSATINIATSGYLTIGSYFYINGIPFKVTKISYKKPSFLSTKSGLYAVGISAGTGGTLDFNLSLLYYDSKGKVYIK